MTRILEVCPGNACGVTILPSGILLPIGFDAGIGVFCLGILRPLARRESGRFANSVGSFRDGRLASDGRDGNIGEPCRHARQTHDAAFQVGAKIAGQSLVLLFLVLSTKDIRIGQEPIVSRRAKNIIIR